MIKVGSVIKKKKVIKKKVLAILKKSFIEQSQHRKRNLHFYRQLEAHMLPLVFSFSWDRVVYIFGPSGDVDRFP